MYVYVYMYMYMYMYVYMYMYMYSQGTPCQGALGSRYVISVTIILLRLMAIRVLHLADNKELTSHL